MPSRMSRESGAAHSMSPSRHEEHEEGKLDVLVRLPHHEHVRLQVVDGHEGLGEIEGDVTGLPSRQSSQDRKESRPGGNQLSGRSQGLAPS